MIRILSITLLCIITATSSYAKTTKAKKTKPHIQQPVQASLVVDAKNGEILHFSRASEKLYPASTVKMMTLYLAFDALESGKLSMDQMLPVSRRAQNMRPCKLGLIAGEKISVRDAIIGTQVKSANDAAVVLAEALGNGSEDNFAVLMNKKAKKLGLLNTNFTNASGWHDKNQYSTALDLARLGLALQTHHTKYAPLLKKTQFTFRGKVINGHNRVLAHYPGAEGGKTGFHSPGGFNLVSKVKRNGKDLVAVVTGGTSAKSRDTKMVALLDRHCGVTKPTTIHHTKFAANNKISKKRKYRRA